MDLFSSGNIRYSTVDIWYSTRRDFDAFHIANILSLHLTFLLFFGFV